MKTSATLPFGFSFAACGLLAGCGSQPARAVPAVPPPVSSTSQFNPPPFASATALLPTIAAPAAPDAKSTQVAYVLHVVDVGTGLGIFVEGPDFALVYDAGSNDDNAIGDQNRFVAYLKAAKPDLKVIDHVILSHPHADHVDLLPDVLSAYSVKNVWDSGAETGLCGYERLIKATKDTGATYHSAANDAGMHDVKFTKACKGMPKSFAVQHGDRITQGLRVSLGSSASMTFLHANSKTEKDPNDNSLVVRLSLGTKRMLLVGDAGAGVRADPGVAPTTGSVEARLIALGSEELDSDVLVAGRHGSKTSSRDAFLTAVTPTFSIISSGPKKYGTVSLPDAITVETLRRYSDVFETDKDDDACSKHPAKIGRDNDGMPGGCNNVRVTIMGNGAMKAAYWTMAD